MKFIVIVFGLLSPLYTQGMSTSEWIVKDYFHDAPDLVKIALCESQFRQFEKDGEVLRGRLNKSDVGVMQINLYYHGETAKELGYDLFTIDGNMGYARYLFERYGDSPWIHSKKCWG